ncbi:hypothetical protein ACFLVZ_01745 [Chloroflexota bacterium]
MTLKLEVKHGKEGTIQEEHPLVEGFPLDEEQTEEVVLEIQGLVEQDDQESVIDLFSNLRPGDHSEVIEDLPHEI